MVRHKTRRLNSSLGAGQLVRLGRKENKVRAEAGAALPSAPGLCCPQPCSAGATLHPMPLCPFHLCPTSCFPMARATGLVGKRSMGRAEDHFDRTTVWFSLPPWSEWPSSHKHFPDQLREIPAHRAPYLISLDWQVDFFINCQHFLWVGLCEKKEAKNGAAVPSTGHPLQ